MRRHVGGDRASVSLPGPGDGELGEPFRGRLPLRQPLRGVAVDDLVEPEGAAGGDLARPLDGVRIVGEERAEGGGRLQVVFGVRPDAPAGGGKRDPMTHAGEDVLQPATGRRVVEDLHGCHERNLVSRGAPAEAGLLLDLFGLAMAGDQGIEPVAEGLAKKVGDAVRLDVAADEAPGATPQRDQAPGVGGDLVPSDLGYSLGRAQAPDSEQPAEMCVALPVLGQEHDRRAVVQGDLGARDERDAEFARPDVGPDDPGDTVPVREGQRLDSVLVACLDQLFRV